MFDKIITGETLQTLQTLPENIADMGVTSPPYNKGEKQNGGLIKPIIYDSITDKKKEDAYQKEQISVLRELYRIIKPGGSLFYNHKVRYKDGFMLHPVEWLLKTEWTIRQEIVWNRGRALNIRGWRFWEVDERIYWLYKPIGKDRIGKEIASKYAKLSSIWSFPPEQLSPHPAPFPLVLPLRAIATILSGNGLVIDPYSGSGTTLVAAKLLGKSYLGIDISPNYNAKAEERLANYFLEKEVANVELSRHRVAKFCKISKQPTLF